MTTPSIRFRAVRRLASSLLGPFVQPYITQLQQQGYHPISIRTQLRHMMSVNRWLIRTGRDLGDLNEEALDRFWRHHLPGQKRLSAAPALAPYPGITL
jgi:hypothetical protein